MPTLNEVSKEWLQEEYHTKNRSFDDIAKELGTYAQKVRRQVIKFGIVIKDKHTAMKAAIQSGRLSHPTAGKKRSIEELHAIAKGVAKSWKQLTKAQLDDRIKKSQDAWNRMSDEQRLTLQRLAEKGCRKASQEGSKAELFLKDELVKAGYRVECHKKHIIQNKQLHLDIFLPEFSTAIEINGPSHYLPVWGEEQLQKTIRSDQKKAGLLALDDILLIRVVFMGEPSMSRCVEIGKELLETVQKIKDGSVDRSVTVIKIGEVDIQNEQTSIS